MKMGTFMSFDFLNNNVKNEILSLYIYTVSAVSYIIYLVILCSYEYLIENNCPNLLLGKIYILEIHMPKTHFACSCHIYMPVTYKKKDVKILLVFQL